MSGKWDKWYYYGAQPKTPPTQAPDEFSWLGFGWSVFGWATVAAIAIVSWQGYRYLRHGIWPELTVISLVQWCGSSWARNPTDWLGVYKMLNSFALSLFIFFAGLAVLFLSTPLADLSAARQRHRDQAAVVEELARKRALGYEDKPNDA